ncbi:glycosyltransferase family 10 domain-containing protein [Reichenbachiella sp.]|uniref:glycosyltransferase family 10 domain-containing protein n=1 Tax=Reichenbachiella sp. TaxID=2184521 RepID=UPI003B5ADDFA
MKEYKKIKFTFPFPKWPIERQLPNQSLVLGDYEFCINDPTCSHPDFWVVFDGLLADEVAHCNKENTIFFTAEPPTFKRYNHDFLQQFGHAITCQKEINHPSLHYYHQGHPWFVGKSYDELISLSEVPKNKNISIITSNKLITDGHKKRFEFCHRLKEHFGEAVDLYGRGIKDFEDKWEVLAPYRYSVAIENEYLDDWFTEKLYDCFLSLTVPIYYGCPNLEKYFDTKSILQIDVAKIDETIAQIENLIEVDRYDSYIPALKSARLKYLNQFNIFFLIISLVNELDSSNHSEEYTLYSENHWHKNKRSIFNKFKSIHETFFK